MLVRVRCLEKRERFVQEKYDDPTAVCRLVIDAEPSRKVPNKLRSDKQREGGKIAVDKLGLAPGSASGHRQSSEI